jgi:hypothetical protein
MSRTMKLWERIIEHRLRELLFAHEMNKSRKLLLETGQNG